MAGKNELVAIAQRILAKHGFTEGTYNNICLVDENGVFSVNVVRFGVYYERTKQAVEKRKRQNAKFKRAAKAFKAETGCHLRKFW